MDQILICIIIIFIFGGYAVFMQHQLEIKTQEILSLKFQLQEAVLSQKALTQSIFSQVSKIDGAVSTSYMSSAFFTGIVGVCLFIGIVIVLYHIIPDFTQLHLELLKKDEENQKLLINLIHEVTQNVAVMNNTNVTGLTENVKRVAIQLLELRIEMEKLTPIVITPETMSIMGAAVAAINQDSMVASISTLGQIGAFIF